MLAYIKDYNTKLLIIIIMMMVMMMINDDGGGDYDNDDYCIKELCNLSLELQGPFTHRLMHANLLPD